MKSHLVATVVDMRLFFLAVILISITVSCGSKNEQGSSSESSNGGKLPAPVIAPAPTNRMPSPGAKQVVILPDETDLLLEGSLEPNKDVEYVLGQEKGNLLTAHAITPETDLNVAVYRADTGAQISDETPRNPNFFIATLPETIGYLVVVRAGSKPSSFRLEIEVPRRIILDDATPVIELSNRLPANGEIDYLTPPGIAVSAQLIDGRPDAYLMAHGLAGTIFLKAEANSKNFAGAPVVKTEGLILRVVQGNQEGEAKLRVRRQ